MTQNTLDVPAVAAAPLPVEPLGTSSERYLLSQRIRRIGVFSTIVGLLGSIIVTLAFVWFDDVSVGLLFAFESDLVRGGMFFGVPILLVGCYAPLATSGLRLWRGGQHIDRGQLRRTLLVMRALLIPGMLLSLLGAVFGLVGSGGLQTLFSIGLICCLSYVLSAILATRVRDLLRSLAVAIREPQPRAVLPADQGSPPQPAVPLAAIPAGPLQYASERADPAADFLRLFDVLAIFGCIAYGLQLPLLIDQLPDLSAAVAGLPPPMRNAYQVIIVLSAMVAIGWAVWGAIYIGWGAVLYRIVFGLAVTSFATVILQTSLSFQYASRGAGMDVLRMVQWNLPGWVFPGVMLFCLTRATVKRAFRPATPSADAPG